MSIIHEALKKAGKDRSIRAGGVRPSVSVERADPKKSSSGSPMLIIGGVLTAAVLLLAAPLLMRVLSPTQVPSEVLASPPPPNASIRLQPPSPGVHAQFSVEEIRTPQPAFFRPFTVSGIILSSDGAYGIINNQITGVGQTVAGAKVLSIDEREVKLDYKGQTITVSVSERNTL